MNGGNLRAEALVRWCIAGKQMSRCLWERQWVLLRVHGSGGCVISKAEPVSVVSSPFIEKALIGAVPTAFGF
jgi:hypothetical protein